MSALHAPFCRTNFAATGRSPDESVARFYEGVEQAQLLLTRENVTHRGHFHTIENTTSLPYPTQKPRPKFYIAAQNKADSFAFAGRMGYSVMAIPPTGAMKRPMAARQFRVNPSGRWPTALVKWYRRDAIWLTSISRACYELRCCFQPFLRKVSNGRRKLAWEMTTRGGVCLRKVHPTLMRVCTRN